MKCRELKTKKDNVKIFSCRGDEFPDEKPRYKFEIHAGKPLYIEGETDGEFYKSKKDAEYFAEKLKGKRMHELIQKDPSVLKLLDWREWD